MSLFPKRPDHIGIERGSSSFKIATLSLQRRGWHVIHLKEIESECADEEIEETVEKEAIKATALPANQTLVRPFHMQLKREKDVLSALDFQAESLLPFPLDTALIEAQVIHKNEKGTALTLSAIKKEHLKRHLEEMESINPEGVTSIFSALCAFSSLMPESAQRLFIIHVGDDEVACVLVEKGKLLKAHAFDRNRDFTVEIKKMVLSLPEKAFESIYLLGSEEPSFVDDVKKATGETPHYPTIPDLQLPQERLVTFGVAIGIAIAATNTNFRKQEFSYPHPYRRFYKPFGFTVACSLLLSASLFTLSTFSHRGQEQATNHRYQTLLASLTDSNEATMPRTAGEYREELARIEERIIKRPDTFPLLPGVPKVRETLAFLTNHVKGVQIESLRYQMVKRPRHSFEKEKYRVRIDLDFSARDSSDARRVHEALLAPNSLIDPKGELTWEQSQGRYKTTFFLKDKTRYHG